MPNTASVAPLHQNSRGNSVYHAINKMETVKCALTSVQAGDQLLVSFRLPPRHQTPLNLKIQASTMEGNDITLGLSSFTLAYLDISLIA